MNNILKNIKGLLITIFLIVGIVFLVDMFVTSKNGEQTNNAQTQQTNQSNIKNDSIGDTENQLSEVQLKSRDITNANEITNAIERFTSEYELYCQAIGSNSLNINNLDSSQSRVYRVINGAKNKTDIMAIEKEDKNVLDNFSGRAIYRSTKYPVNKETVIAIVENYIQDKKGTLIAREGYAFWYSPYCGVVVCEKSTATVSQLNTTVISGMDAYGNKLTNNNIWINLSE